MARPAKSNFWQATLHPTGLGKDGIDGQACMTDWPCTCTNQEALLGPEGAQKD